jgi:hypothetical protein
MAELPLGALLERSVPLVFERCGVKLYARTPAGEYAYGDSQGLYEWRDGDRIHYSGGDQQAASAGGFHQHSDIVDVPFLRGLEALKMRDVMN